MVRRGEWVRLRRGGYVSATCWSAADPAERHLLRCAALVSRSHGLVVSHRSAALLLGLPLLDPPVEPEATRPRPPGCPALHPPERRSALLPQTDTCRVRGLHVTSLARTAADLGRTLPADAAQVVLDGALRAESSRAGIDAVLDRMPRWSGVRQARRLLSQADPGAESALETLARLRVVEQGFPVPRTQVAVVIQGRRVRLDLGWEHDRVGLEADGRLKYQQPDDLWAEKLREDRLRDAGWEIVRCTWADVQDGGAALAQRLTRAFRRRAV